MTDSLTRPLAPLPINVRPRLGEATVHYVQRLAHANHLKPTYLLRVLARPTPSRRVGVDLERLATLSGRSTDILKITLADAAPPGLPVETPTTVRLERIAARKGRHRSFNVVGQVRQNARRSKGTLRQLSNEWDIPRWLIKRILSPAFPDRPPAIRLSITERTHATLLACYEQGMTPGQAWTDLLDNHDTPFISEHSVRIRFGQWDRERGKARLEPE
ncbi:hypothetical protein [Kitasatospora sp. NPDC056531]|uniref:hypothetical protein n=1 Tax=Kitasatospora sp. NPDC056531 TaxID=3345856 RepID=UPI0036B3DBE0